MGTQAALSPPQDRSTASRPRIASNQQRTQKASAARLKHGMYSHYTVIPGESRHEYEALQADLFDDLRPQGRAEVILVEQMVQAQWKLQRLWMREAGVHMDYEQHHPLGNTPLPLQLRACARQHAFSRASGELDKLTLDQARCLNQFQKTLRAFMALRDQRRRNFPHDGDEVRLSNDAPSGKIVDRGAKGQDAPAIAAQPAQVAPAVGVILDARDEAAEDTARLAPSDSSDSASGKIVDRGPTPPTPSQPPKLAYELDGFDLALARANARRDAADKARREAAAAAEEAKRAQEARRKMAAD